MLAASAQEMGTIPFLAMMVRAIDWRLSELEADFYGTRDAQKRKDGKPSRKTDLEALATVVERLIEQFPGGLTARGMIELAGAELDDVRGGRTTPARLEKDLAELDCLESWTHGRAVVWRLKSDNDA